MGTGASLPRLPRVRASPGATAGLELDKEFDQIRRYLEVTPEWDAIELVHEPRAMASNLLQLCEREEPDIVHFAGHADKAGRVQMHGADAIVRIPAQALGELFAVI